MTRELRIRIPWQGVSTLTFRGEGAPRLPSLQNYLRASLPWQGSGCSVFGSLSVVTYLHMRSPKERALSSESCQLDCDVGLLYSDFLQIVCAKLTVAKLVRALVYSRSVGLFPQ